MRTLLKRLFSFRRIDDFDSATAPNEELRGLTRAEAKFAAERKHRELIEAYIRGELSGYQCRIHLNDYLRDSIQFSDEIELIKSSSTCHRDGHY